MCVFRCLSVVYIHIGLSTAAAAAEADKQMENVGRGRAMKH